MIDAMSAIGTKRTSAFALHMSAFDPKRAISGRRFKCHVKSVSFTDMKTE